MALWWLGFLSTGCCVGVACWYGKTVSWDVLHYHLYAGLSADGSRLQQDFLAAGPQSYLNPYALWPFHAMDHAGVPPRLLAAILAVFQSLNAWLALGLAALLMPGRPLLWVLAWAFTLANPVFISELGTSYTDVTTSVPVVLAMWLMVRSWAKPDRRWAGLCGVLMGAAFALKMSNAPYALAMGLVWPMAWQAWRDRIRGGIHYCLGAVVGLTLAGGVWFWQVGRALGNPVFPAFNSVFESPLHAVGAAANGAAARFVPVTWWDALIRPLTMSWPTLGAYVEGVMPDVRFLVLFSMLALFPLIAWSRPGTHQAHGVRELSRPTPLAALCFVVLLAWVLWLASSGNGRYLMPLCMVVGVLVVAVWHRLLEGGRWFWYPMLTVLAVQYIQLCIGAQLRWDEQPEWGSRWVPVSVPPRLQKEANLYLGAFSNARTAILAGLHPDSGQVTINGQLALSPNSPGSQRVHALLERYRGHVWVLAPTDAWVTDPKPVLPQEAVKAAARWGYKPRLSEPCERIVLGVATDVSRMADMFRQDAMAHGARRSSDVLLACPLDEAPSLRMEQEAERRAVDMAMNALEEACPRLFRPKGPATIKHSSMHWSRTYSSTDAEMVFFKGRLKFSATERDVAFVDVGSARDWPQGQAPRPDCQ